MVIASADHAQTLADKPNSTLKNNGRYVMSVISPDNEASQCAQRVGMYSERGECMQSFLFQSVGFAPRRIKTVYGHVRQLALRGIFAGGFAQSR